MLSQGCEVEARLFRPGEIVDLPYGNALVLVAIGKGTIVDADNKHVEAIEHLSIYGGDSWFRHGQQTVSRVAEYLAQAEQPGEKTH
jgi:hypothetical protein